MLDCVSLEMRMALIMAQQEASGFRFDVNAAERVHLNLARKQRNRERSYFCFLYVLGRSTT